eukprot:g4757.t1
MIRLGKRRQAGHAGWLPCRLQLFFGCKAATASTQAHGPPMSRVASCADVPGRWSSLASTSVPQHPGTLPAQLAEPSHSNVGVGKRLVRRKRLHDAAGFRKKSRRCSDGDA